MKRLLCGKLLSCFYCLGMAVLALAFASCMVPYKYNAPEREESKTITVHGTGRVTGRADIASITFSVVTQEWVAKTASDSNAVITAKVCDAIKDAGVSASDIDTTAINIYRQDTYANGRSFPGRYRLTNNIVVRLRNVDKVSSVVDAAVAAGATGLSGLTFSIGDTSDLLREARTLAIKDASETAALLAGASGCKIGDAIMISEGDDSNVIGPKSAISIEETAPSGSATSAPVSPQDVLVTAGVTVTYLLQ